MDLETKTCYLAVDGGNSKTEYRLLDASGAVIAARRGGGSNHETMPGGFTEAAALIMDNCGQMLAETDRTVSNLADAVLGLAGADYAEQSAALTEGLHALGLQKCLVVNDGYLGVMAGCENGVGVCYSAGSGVTCAGMNAEGKRVQLGGLGILSGDTGGGYDIVAFVYRSVYQQVFFGKRATALKDVYYTLFDLHTPEEFLASATRIQNEEAARQLIGLFFNAVETGDEIASRYAARAASHAANCILGVVAALALSSPVQLALSGSIFTAVASQTYLRMIEYELNRREKAAFAMRVNDHPPVDGAARWVRMRNGLKE